MVGTAIEDDLTAHVVMLGEKPRLVKEIRIMLGENPRIILRMLVDDIECVIEGRRRKWCVEKGILHFDLLKPESTPDSPIINLAARECILDAFERLARTGQSFATVMRQDWGSQPMVWCVWPSTNWAAEV